MHLLTLIKGLTIGLSIAAPVGPIGVLCIRRTLVYGRMLGFVSGLGAATADAFYGCIAAFGLTFISTFLINQAFWLRLIGGGFLIYLGVLTFLAKPSDSDRDLVDDVRRNNLLSAYASTLFLTLTNPMTIISFVAIFAALGIGAGTGGDYRMAALLVLGVFTGSCLWWFTLSNLTGFLKHRLTPRGLSWVNKISGLIIFTFGMIAWISLLFG